MLCRIFPDWLFSTTANISFICTPCDWVVTVTNSNNILINEDGYLCRMVQVQVVVSLICIPVQGNWWFHWSSKNRQWLTTRITSQARPNYFTYFSWPILKTFVFCYFNAVFFMWAFNFISNDTECNIKSINKKTLFWKSCISVANHMFCKLLYNI